MICVNVWSDQIGSDEDWEHFEEGQGRGGEFEDEMDRGQCIWWDGQIDHWRARRVTWELTDRIHEETN